MHWKYIMRQVHSANNTAWKVHEYNAVFWQSCPSDKLKAVQLQLQTIRTDEEEVFETMKMWRTNSTDMRQAAVITQPGEHKAQHPAYNKNSK